ncbi:DNA adenine methylase [Bombilactobacillus bombi]|uniref:site-specific DNA-methyltransferase (adenine-specific) n=1 Tax=Bombilactobacillus bombi TaxID=1303590 RepID=A0A3R6YLA6_9LACO|nr:DNA adenine methylase [Bombilactobacillus bombi]RHW49693.1 DNA adenine methylase [Bombilactobacillus bombi]
MPITKSLLRYPGGKSQLTNFVKHLLEINNNRKIYAEAFAGGFGLALNLLFNNNVETVLLNDYDPSIFSLWYNILNNPDELIYKIEHTEVSVKEWHNQRNIHLKTQNNPYSLDNAYSTLFLNRTNVSGIINGGPIGGMNQSGKFKIDCRFKKDVLINKTLNICKYKDSIILSNLDANVFINKELTQYKSEDTFIFYDPPYYKQGKNLYMSFVNKEEHAKLSKNIISKYNYNWITTYDIEPEIYKLYSKNSQAYEYSLNYSANRKRKAKEYLFANLNTKIESFDKVELKRLN